jgi:tetratricopeptide (TPR) repeat protein
MADAAPNILADALAAHGNGDLNKAETLYRRVLALEPANAEALHNLGAVGLQSGHPAAAAGLFRQTLVADPGYNDAYCNLGLALRAQGLLGEAAEAYGQAINADPDMAEAHSNLGVVRQEQGALDAAADSYREAIRIAPDLADAHCNLGILLHEQGALQEAADCLQTALEAAPGNPVVEANLGAVMAGLERHEDAELHLKRALRGQPQNPDILFNIGRAAYAGGRLDRAVKFYRLAIEFAPDFAAAHHSLAHALLARGELAEGWREYDWRWRAKNFTEPPQIPRFPKWDGSPPAGKRMLIWDEQGVGDKLLFAGLIPELLAAGAECVIKTDPRLVGLFQRSFEAASVVPSERGQKAVGEAGDFDFQLPIGDLPRWLRPDLRSFRPLGRYLRVDDGLRDAMDKRYRDMDGEFVVGISWASNPPKGVSLEALLPVLSLPGITWVNLQYGDHASKIETLRAQSGIEIHSDPGIDPIKNLDGFAAQVAAMDAVVTIQNTALYVAGGVGVPTFALTAPAPDWRWFGGAGRLGETPQQDPWHENVTLFKRRPGEAPDAAVADIADHLRRITTPPAR